MDMYLILIFIIILFGTSFSRGSEQGWNLALKGEAYQVSTSHSQFGSSRAKQAVDGITETCAITELDSAPWWWVDLGQQYHIYNITITTQPAPFDEDLHHLRVSVGMSEPVFPEVPSSAASGATDCAIQTHPVGISQTISMNCLSTGRYLILQIRGEEDSERLRLCEVEVFGGVTIQDTAQEMIILADKIEMFPTRSLSTSQATHVVHNLNDILKDVPRNTNSSNRMAYAMEHFGEKVNLKDGEQFYVTLSELTVWVARVEDDTALRRQYQTLSRESSDEVSPSVELSPELMSLVPRSACLQVITYNTDDLYQSSQKDRKIISGVISISVENTTIDILQEPLVITLPHQNVPDVSKMMCVYWEFSADKKQGWWSPDGCHLVIRTPNQTVCHCYHLTSFALLLDVYQEANSEKNNRALSVMSFIGLSLSALCLSVTLVTFAVFKHLRRDPQKILMCLCATLLIMIVLFLVGSMSTKYELGCMVTGMLLHYAVLASLAWMCMEAIDMYLKLVKVVGAYHSRLLLKLSLIAWGVPLVIVAISAATSFSHYGPINNALCWLKSDAFFVGIVGPLALVLTINIVIFITIMHKLATRMKSSVTEQNNHQTNEVKHRLRQAIAICVLLGLTWIFAFLPSLLFQYLFVLFNSLQGVFIFIVSCVSNSDVRKAWGNKVLRKQSNRRPSKQTDTFMLSSSGNATP